MYDSEKAHSLKKEIAEAFENVDYPKGFITDHECEECFGVRKTFLNKNWKQITPEILQENYDKLPLFSPEAFHCFLPAYLIYAIDHIDEDDEVYDFCCYHFMLGKNDDSMNEWRKYRYLFFNKRQLKALLGFIDLALSSKEFENSIDLENGEKWLKEEIESSLK
jgi:adenine-specific DNA methylase